MSTNKVIFAGKQWGVIGRDITGSKMTGRSPARNRKYVMRMRNRKFRNAPSGTFSPEVTQWSCAHAQPVHGYLWPKGWKGVRKPNRKLRNIPLVGPFHRKLATGSSFFPRIFHISSTTCWLGCSLRRRRLPLSLVIDPFYFHNYI